MEHQIDHGDQDHALAAGWEHLVVLAHSSVTADPGKGAFHAPSLGQHDEANGVAASLDNVQYPPAEGLGPSNEFACVTSVRPDAFQSRIQPAEPTQHQLGPVPILDIGGMDHNCQDESQRVYHDVPLATLDFLARVISPGPPFSVVLTLWLSTMAAEGDFFRPAARRTLSRRAS